MFIQNYQLMIYNETTQQSKRFRVQQYLTLMNHFEFSLIDFLYLKILLYSNAHIIVKLHFVPCWLEKSILANSSRMTNIISSLLTYE